MGPDIKPSDLIAFADHARRKLRGPDGGFRRRRKRRRIGGRRSAQLGTEVAERESAIPPSECVRIDPESLRKSGDFAIFDILTVRSRSIAFP